jgi:protein-L-isoaspartate(D-aspartate) O-methyltransferase
MDTDPHADDTRRLLRLVEDDFACTVGETGVARPSERVRDALAAVPRHRFVPLELADDAYEDRPLPIGQGQTISQPFIVALMSELLEAGDAHVVLEIGTGCGYQTAVLARLARHVISIEILPELAAGARMRLAALGVDNVTLHVGDGHDGWAPAAPYERILVTAAPRQLPVTLVDQLCAGGRMVLPMGPHLEAQDLCVVDKRADGTLSVRRTIGVRFVPMTRFGDLP